MNSSPLWPPAECLLTYDEVECAIAALAGQLNQRLLNKTVLAICVMNGGLVFSGLLLPQLSCALRLDFLRVSRYRNTTQGTDELDWLVLPSQPLQDQTVLLLDDIYDEGKTLEALVDWARKAGAAEVITAVMANKQHDRKPLKNQMDYAAFSVPDAYVFGMGMDYQGLWRNASGIWALTEDAV